MAVFFYEYLESKFTPNELTDEVLNSESFKNWYNWHFKLGNSRFLIKDPSTYKDIRRDWNILKKYGMDDEGYLTIDTAEKRNLLEKVKKSRNFETHFVVYKDLNGNTILKFEKPIYVGKLLSKTTMMTLEGLQIQTVEDIQNFLKEKNTIHRYMGKWLQQTTRVYKR